MELSGAKKKVLLEIEWFKNVGQEFSKDYKIEIKRVKSWKEAMKYNQSVYYGNKLVHESNVIRKKFSSQKGVEKGNEWILAAQKEWDLYAIDLDDFFKKEISRKIKEANPNVQEKRILYILSLEYMENVVIGNKESNFLRDFSELLKDGYYPCGWNQTTKQFYVY